MADRKFKFKFIVITEDYIFVDQQVHSYSFTNIGTAKATINNGFILNSALDPTIAGFHNNVYNEPLLAGEKTAQEYKVIFDPTSRPENRAIQVIQKIEVFDYEVKAKR